MAAKSMQRPTADLTVVVTVYNHQAYIEQCLDSISTQTVSPRQLIVIDDASRDESSDVITRWLTDHPQDWTVVRHTRNVGVCGTLNEALEAAKGTFFCHVSGDDWEEPDRFERQVAAFEAADSAVALLIGDIREVDGGGMLITDHDFAPRLDGVIGRSARNTALSRLLAENVIPAPGVMLRTEVLRSAGGFDESLAFEDYDMWMRLAESYEIAYEPGIVANYRIVRTSMWRNIDRRVAMISSEAEMLAKHIGRNTADDDLITRRLITIAGELVELGSPSETRRVLSLAGRSSNGGWPRQAAAITWSRRSLNALRRRYHVELGIPAHRLASK